MPSLGTPLADLSARLAEIPDAEVIAGCRGRHCVLSHDGARRLLRDEGVAARVSEDGVGEWVADGLHLAHRTSP